MRRLGAVAMTPAERQARRKERLLAQIAALQQALARIQTARTIREAREIAAAACPVE